MSEQLNQVNRHVVVIKKSISSINSIMEIYDIENGEWVLARDTSTLYWKDKISGGMLPVTNEAVDNFEHGTAAGYDVGTKAGQIPLVESVAGLLGTAAMYEVGTGTNDLPNYQSVKDLLGTVAILNVGVEPDEVPLMEDVKALLGTVAIYNVGIDDGQIPLIEDIRAMLGTAAAYDVGMEDGQIPLAEDIPKLLGSSAKYDVGVENGQIPLVENLPDVLGTAAVRNTGTESGQIPLIDDIEGLLGTAAVRDIGTEDGQVPLVKDIKGLLGTVAILDTGIEDGQVPKVEDIKGLLGTAASRDTGKVDGQVPLAEDIGEMQSGSTRSILNQRTNENLKTWVGELVDYNAIPVKDESTIYMIVASQIYTSYMNFKLPFLKFPETTFKFETENFQSFEMEVPMMRLGEMEMPRTVRLGGPEMGDLGELQIAFSARDLGPVWELKKNGKTYVNHKNYESFNWREVNYNDYDNELTIYLSGYEDKASYEFIGVATNVHLTSRGGQEQFSLLRGDIGFTDEFDMGDVILPLAMGKVTVTNFSHLVESTSFNLPTIDLAVPDTLPPNITDMSSMFDGCDLFNYDIGMWDVSNVTTMSDMFRGAYTFNQDLSTWNTSSVINMDYMFYGAAAFTSDLSQWKVGNVQRMREMFRAALNFNSDLTQWCVGNFPKEPLNFGAHLAKETLPVWGTCPNEIYIDTKGIFEFDVVATSEDRALDLRITNPTAGWKLVENGKIIATASYSDYNVTSVDVYSETTSITFSNTAAGQSHYEFYGADVAVTLSKNSWRTKIERVIVTQLPTKAIQAVFGLEEIHLVMNSLLPATFTSTHAMFQNCKNFNSEILTKWDTSNLKLISNMFANCITFNQDLSNWCLSNVPVVTDYQLDGRDFDIGTTAWVLPKPIVNACPERVTENVTKFTTIDITGNSGVFLTLSKNNGPFTTFNLSDPYFDVEAFQEFVSLNEAKTGFAFMGYPVEMVAEQPIFKGLSGLRADGKANTASHVNGYATDALYVTDKSVTAPFNIAYENTTLTAKATPDVPAEYDIFYTLSGSDTNELVSIISDVVFMFNV